MKKILLYIILINTSLILWAEESTGTTLFSLDLINKDDLYLSLDGSWKFDLSTFAEGNISAALTNLIFTQVPDISASLWLFNRYFFETNITNNSEENVFLLGYQNSNSILQEIRIGNDDLNIGSYAGYTPSVNENRSPGTRFKIVTNNTNHEILARYTSEESNYIEYKGYNILEEEDLDISNYNKARYFILPFEDQIDLNLYIKLDDELSIIDEQDYIYYKNKNILYISELEFDQIYLSINSLDKNEVQTELYEFIQPRNNPGILTEKSPVELWDKYTTQLGSITYLKLYAHGAFSPFEHLGTYDFSNIESGSDNDLYIDGNRSINYTIKNSILLIENSDINYSDLLNRYPFMEIDKDIYSIEGRGLNSETVISLISLTKVNEISVPDTAKENSLVITINGLAYQDFDHNSDSGVITFGKEISPFDEIIIRYKSDVFPGTGNLLLSYGSSYNILQGLNLELSSTGSWDFSTDDYSYNYNQNVGELNTNMKLNYDSKYITAELNSNIKINNPDTLGSYLLFNYDRTSINIPISSTELIESSGGTPLIKRYNNDLNLTISDIKELKEDPLGGAYYVDNIYENTSSKVIVIETEELTGESYSSVDISLDEYKQDLSWITELNLDIYNETETREIEIIFVNPDLDSDDILTKIITLEAGEQYRTYSIKFSRDDRVKLTYIDEIKIKINSGPELFLLLKGVEFTGDSLITHNGTDNFYIRESLQSMEIISEINNTSGDIIISSAISPIDLNNYGIVSFNLDNDGLINDNSIFTINFKNSNNIISTLTIPPGILNIGANSIKVNLDTKKVYINSNYSNDIIWDVIDSDICNSISFNISDYEPESSLSISEIILKEPKLEFYNENSLFLNITPPVDLKLGTFTIFNNLQIDIKNYLINSDDIIYRGELDLSFNFLGSNIDTGIIYDDDINSINYTVKMPILKSKMSLVDSFYYNENSHRTNSINIDTDFFDMDLSFSDTTGTLKGLRESELITSFTKEGLLSITSSMDLTQERDAILGDLEKEVLSSYEKLIPTNSLELKNSLNSTIDIGLNLENIFFKTSLSGELTQEFDTDRVDNNLYKLGISSGLNIGKLSFTPMINTQYRYESSSSINSITTGLEEYIIIFNRTNPFSKMDLNDLLFTDSISSYYNKNYEENIRELSSVVGLSVSNSYSFNSLFDILLPESISYSINKSFLKEESKNSTNLKNIISADFTQSNIIKNSLSFNNLLNIENSSNTYTFQWKLIYYKEMISGIFLDINNDLNLSSDDSKNVCSAELSWQGKSGPLLIIPIVDKVFDSPYSYTHKESIYFNIEQLDSKVEFGIKHETILNVLDINETNFYVEIGYNTYKLDKLNFELGLYTTLIF